jgi:aminoglycoside phosphotransferase (APT) family kinase protein
MPTSRDDILAILRRAGLVGPDDSPRMVALAGGVSSDIWRVDLEPEPVCVKRALARLKVEADWRAPVERNAYEAAWIAVARAAVPTAAPELLWRDEVADALVMRYLDPEQYPLWKGLLRDGRVEPAHAAAVGDRLVRIHASTARRPEIAARFPTDRIFHDIRLEPYLLATAARHPDLEGVIAGLARRTATTKLALVHGDVSPKNILIGPDGPVFLDSECAWYGDPAFDLAFCLNHLLLKCLWVPEAASRLLHSFDRLAATYLSGVTWEPPPAIEARTATLLPALFLARVDGKSPVEYLTTETQKDRVRNTARRFLAEPVEALAAIRSAWAEELGV